MRQFFTVLLSFIAISVFGQATKEKQDTVFFSKKFKLGFCFGFGATNFKLQPNDLNQTIYKDSLNSLSVATPMAVYDFGVLFDFRLKNQISLRTKILFHDETLKLSYRRSNNSENLNFSLTSLILPIHLILQTKGEKMRAFLLTGTSFNFGLGAGASDKEIYNKYAPKQFDMALDVGIGFHKILKNIIISPELKFSQGLFNINATNKNIYTETINSIYRQNIIFTINFSG